METKRSGGPVRVKFPASALRRFASPARASAGVEEYCELCSVALPGRHRHLLEMEHRRLVCACDACALRFDGVIGGRFSLIPRDTLRLDGFSLSDAQWTELSLPIDLAFFFHSSAAGRVVAFYPSPAGAVESTLGLGAWNDLAAANPVLAELQPDVQALLVNRRGSERAYYLAPIDSCYELVGLIRSYWTGLSGGSDVWREIARFFAGLDPAIRPVAAAAAEASHA